MVEIYRVFSIIWESEQDFCSQPFFQTHFSSFTSSPWRVWKCFIQSLHLYPIWISHMRVIDPWDSWVWKWQLVVLKSNLAHRRAISKEKSGCSGPCPPLSWASPKNASPRMDFPKECISKDGLFPLPELHHSPSRFCFPLCPTSIAFAANLSCCLLAFPWAPQRAWFHPLSSQTSVGWRAQTTLLLCLLCVPNSDVISPLWWVWGTNCAPRSLSISGTPGSSLVLVCIKSSKGSRSWEALSSLWLQGHLGTEMLVIATLAVWSAEVYKVWTIKSCTLVPFAVSHKFPSLFFP